MQDHTSCNLCFVNIQKDYERFLVEERAKFDVLTEVKTLPVDVEHTSRFICRGCFKN